MNLDFATVLEGKTHLIAEFHKTDFNFWFHSKEGKFLSYRGIDTVEINCHKHKALEEIPYLQQQFHQPTNLTLVQNIRLCGAQTQLAMLLNP